jgi:hypothetical protein
MKKGEDVDASEHPVQPAVEQLAKIAERATWKPVDVRDQLRLVLHACSIATLIAQVRCFIPRIRIDMLRRRKYTSAV